MLFLKNAEGKPSSSFTMMFMAFGVVTLWLFLSIAEHIGPLHIRAFSGAEAMAYLTPILMLYWGRKQQEITADREPPSDPVPVVVTTTTTTAEPASAVDTK